MEGVTVAFSYYPGDIDSDPFFAASIQFDRSASFGVNFEAVNGVGGKVCTRAEISSSHLNLISFCSFLSQIWSI